MVLKLHGNIDGMLGHQVRDELLIGGTSFVRIDEGHIKKMLADCLPEGGPFIGINIAPHFGNDVRGEAFGTRCHKEEPGKGHKATMAAAAMVRMDE